MKKILLIGLLCCMLLFICACGNAESKSGSSEKTGTQTTTTTKSKKSTKYDTIDVDLSKMSGTVAYSQVYDMVSDPTKYNGKIVKMKGPFSAAYSESTKLYYPSVIISDATACCKQGIEFVLEGDPDYPSGYPKANKEITVVGKFQTYTEGSKKYGHLINAVIL